MAPPTSHLAPVERSCLEMDLDCVSAALGATASQRVMLRLGTAVTSPSMVSTAQAHANSDIVWLLM